MGEIKMHANFWWGILKGRPKHRWEVNIIMDFREIELEVMDWVHLAQDRDKLRAAVNTVMNLWVT